MTYFRSISLEPHFREMETAGVTTIPNLLRADIRASLLQELNGYEMTPEPEEKGPFNVKQRFSAFLPFPSESLFLTLRDELAHWVSAKLLLMQKNYLSSPLELSDLRVQRYEPGLLGISPHRDGAQFINLIAIFVLEGRATFGRCEDRTGKNPWEVRNEPGDLILLRAPGFLGSAYQPFHYVSDVTERRTTFTLRQKTMK